jgi:hypothetical protein
MGTWKKFTGLFVVDDSRGAPSSNGVGSPPDASEIDRILGESRAMLGDAQKPGPPPSQAAPPVALDTLLAQGDGVTDATGEIEEGRPFSRIYDQYQLPPCPHPAEKLLKILEGLAALPTAMRVAAITAMDAAEDAWTIEDPVLDVQRKIQALKREQERLNQRAEALEAAAAAELVEQDAFLAEATRLLQEEMARLQVQLGQTGQEVAQQKASIEARARATREARRREIDRISAEIARLGQVASMFGDGSAPIPRSS